MDTEIWVVITEILLPPRTCAIQNYALRYLKNLGGDCSKPVNYLKIRAKPPYQTCYSLEQAYKFNAEYAASGVLTKDFLLVYPDAFIYALDPILITNQPVYRLSENKVLHQKLQKIIDARYSDRLSTAEIQR